ncbi:hypothetical protein IWX78_000044 [Mycetocola sp. CAN_C7]|uniref:hypothetical protein n=1 Tax=Mycetocola sp. CAN_C7 TaxID=2787724 RepID=UPI0018CABE50
MTETTFLRFTGLIHDDGSFEPGVGWTTTRIRTPLEPNSQHIVEVIDEGDQVLEATAATITVSDDPAAAGRLVARLVAYLPLPDSGHTVRLRHGDEIVHTVDLAPRSPFIGQPELEFREDQILIRWDADHDRALSFNVFISGRRPSTYTLASGLTATELRVDVETLPVDGECTVAVLATDGLRSAHAVSAPLELPHRPPRLTILAPSEGQEISPDSPITLLGTGSFPSGEDLSERSATWSVDEVVVGRGSWIQVSEPLEPGEHTVTVSSDSHGGVSASVAIRVRERSDDEQSWARIAAELDPDPHAGVTAA